LGSNTARLIIMQARFGFAYPLVEIWQAQQHAIPLTLAAYQRQVKLEVAEPVP
jgi:hypothetical protein